MWEYLLFNVQSEKQFEETGEGGGDREGGCKSLLTLLPHARSEVERWLGSRSARGSAAELCLFLLPWRRRLAPPSICSFGTYSCDDHEQSLIKLQRIIPRNHRACVRECVAE